MFSRVFVILMYYFWKVSFVTCERMLSPARISVLVCVIHANRCSVVRNSSKGDLLSKGFMLEVYVCCSKNKPVLVLLMFMPANRKGEY